MEFTKYVKSTDTSKTLLLYLLLNNFEISEIQKITEAEEKLASGATVYKLYGITKELVDTEKIEKEIERIVVPKICSPSSYEYYSDAKTIYAYMPPKDSNQPLFINDLNVISSFMIIEENNVVSSNLAAKLTDSKCKHKGFMFFYDYILKGEFTVGKWHTQYEDKNFYVKYISQDENGEINEVIVFSASGADKSSTFKLVLYIIKKASEGIEWLSDNFAYEIYEMAGSKK